MAVDTVNRLIEELRRCEILDEPQLALIEREATGQFADAKLLAKELISRGWLTRYQAKLLVVGRGSELTLGAYKLLDRLGAGGMGQVFKAVHVPMNRTVALKVVRPELIADEKTLRRFRREVQAAAQLNHPNIVTVFDAARIGDSYYLAMEYIDGVDFADLVRDSGPVPIHSACDWIRQAALGLQHAHDRGLIHRDVKPSNLLLTRRSPGTVKILDMGLARPANLDGARIENQTALTLDGAVLGTPDFMAPEQAKNSSRVDHRADLYALGCTFYYLLTARMPFPVTNVMEKLLKHQFEQPYPVELARPDVPAEVRAVLQRMMAKDAEERFQRGEDIARALEPFCQSGADSSGTIVEAVPAETDERPSSLNTPPRSSNSSPFNFGPPAPNELAVPRNRASGRRLGILLAGAGISMVVAAIALVAVIATLGGSKRSPATESTGSNQARRDHVAAVPNPQEATVRSSAVPSDEELLDACIPNQAAFAAVIHVPQLIKSKAIESHLSPMLKPLLEYMRQLKIDPYTQAGRLIVGIVPGTPDQFIAVLLGTYATNELHDLAKRFLNLGPRDAHGELAVASLPLEKGRNCFLAFVQDSYVAISSDRNLLRDADVAMRNRKPNPGNERIVKLLAVSTPNPTIRFAMLGKFVPGEEPLEAAGIHRLSGSLNVLDSVEMDALAQVRNPRQFREQLRSLSTLFAARALFDPREALVAALLRNPKIEAKSTSDGDLVELRVHNRIPPRDFVVILKAIAKRMAPQQPMK